MDRVLTPLALLATSVALAVAGCGGGDDETATTGTAATDATTLPDTTVSGNGSEESGGGNEAAGPATLPDPEPGSKAAAPGVPTSKEGDNSIQTWGVEASESEREAAIDDVQDYLDARAARDSEAACAHLAADVRAEYTRQGKGSCARGMDLFIEQAPDRALRKEAEIDVLSLRSGGGYGFLIYERRDDGKVYATAVKPEGGEWKIVSVTPNPIF